MLIRLIGNAWSQHPRLISAVQSIRRLSNSLASNGDTMASGNMQPNNSISFKDASGKHLSGNDILARICYNVNENPDAECSIPRRYVESVLQEYDSVLKELEDSLEKYKRALAETENVRSRGNRLVEDAKAFAVQGFCKDLLEVADILDTAVASVDQQALKQANKMIIDFYNGVALTKTVLDKIRKAKNLIPIFMKPSCKFQQIRYRIVMTPSTVFVSATEDGGDYLVLESTQKLPNDTSKNEESNSSAKDTTLPHLEIFHPQINGFFRVYYTVDFTDDILFQTLRREKLVQPRSSLPIERLFLHARYRMIQILCQWYSKLSPESLYLAVSLFDICLSKKIAKPSKIPLVAAAALHIAIKFNEFKRPEVEDIACLINEDVKALLDMERVFNPTAVFIFQCFQEFFAMPECVKHRTMYFMEIAMALNVFDNSMPSKHVAVSYALASMLFSHSDVNVVLDYIGLKVPDTSEDITLLAHTVLLFDSQKKRSVIYHKYLSGKFNKTAILRDDERSFLENLAFSQA